jgi:hypothetical protein
MPVVNLRVGDQNVALDPEDATSADRYYAALSAHVDAERNAASEPLKEQLTASKEDASAVRGILVSEIVRIKRLSQKDLDAEKETAYFEGLPHERLKMEWDRLPKSEEINLSASTKNETPADGNIVSELDPDA